MHFFKIFSLDKLLGGVDIFLIPNFLFFNLSKNAKRILIVHDLSFEIYPEFFTGKSRLWHYLINPKKICQQADIIIAISENTKEDIINLYDIDPEKIKVIHQGLNEIFLNQISDEEKKSAIRKYNLPKNYIFYLGNLEPRKNVTSLIAAFEKINDLNLHLVIAGGSAWKYKKIYNLARQSKAKDRIKFLGYIDHKDKPALYSLAKIFVYPSIYEGFGLPPLEAMACGTPVITSHNSSLVEVVGPAGLLIDPNNINDLTQAIQSLLTDPKLLNQLKDRGSNQVKKFNWPKAAQNILNIITNL
jgi:glycosyltransferase involved in cell wall biosynthesis